MFGFISKIQKEKKVGETTLSVNKMHKTEDTYRKQRQQAGLQHQSYRLDRQA